MLVTLALFLLIITQQVRAQIQTKLSGGQQAPMQGDSSAQSSMVYENTDWNKVDIDFLSSYYEQDGNMSAVTGGIGTEQLTDFTQKLIVSVPVSPKLKINVDGGYDYYTSASSDNVDPIRSDDSAEDLRVHGNVGFTYKLNNQHTIGARVGGSGEYDYASVSGGLNYGFLSKDENTTVTANFQSFIDKWDLIYPVELRGQGQLVHTSNRQSHNLSVTLARVLDQKTVASISVEGVYMNGLLSTPFHRVYFADQAAPRVEKMPSTRFKLPIGVRVNRYINEWMILRTSYRYYMDTWQMQAHTASVELAIKPHRFLAITPFYRFHTQTAARYYHPYQVNSTVAPFYTSDTDLAALTSHAYGVGISYQPANGIANIKIPLKKDKNFKLKNIDLKYSHYDRSTGLKANIISLGLGFSIH